jgi:FkbM family methyltransferase
MAARPPPTRTLAIAGQVVRFAVRTRREAERLSALAADEGRMLRRLVPSVRDGDTFLDAGANIGTVTLPVAATRRAECLAFEPEPGNAARLAENVELNDLPNVTVIEAALWSAPGTVALRAGGPSGTGTHSVVAEGENGAESDDEATAVAATTVDELSERGSRPPDVVKVDVEGAELEVLRGATTTLRARAIRELFVEAHPRRLAERGTSEEDLAAFLAELGYEQVWAAPRASEAHRHFRPRGRGLKSHPD